MSVKSFFTHKQCANFKNGFCMAYGMTVNPDDPACPNFTPKNLEPIQTVSKTLPTQYIQVTSTPESGAKFSQFLPRVRRMKWYGMTSGGTRRGRMGVARRGSGRGGGGRGRMGGGFAAGPGGVCICPNCGYTISHVVGTPCYQQKCPRCGSGMTRKT